MLAKMQQRSSLVWTQVFTKKLDKFNQPEYETT